MLAWASTGKLSDITSKMRKARATAECIKALFTIRYSLLIVFL
jgi:hypothetical protein